MTLSKDGTSISFAPIMIDPPVVAAQLEVAESQQISDNQTASNVLRIGASPKRRPDRVEGRIRGQGMRKAAAVNSDSEVSAPTPAASEVAAPAVYDALFDENSSVELIALAGGVKENVVVNEYTGNHVYAYQMTLQGLSAEQQGQEILLSNSEGTPVAKVDAPNMRDAAGSYSEDIAVVLSADGVLTYSPDDGWMASAVYPVVIDPLVYYINVEDVAPYYQLDTYVSSTQPTTGFFGASQLRVSSTETMYSLLAFPQSSTSDPWSYQPILIRNPNDILIDDVWLGLSSISGAGNGKFSIRRVTEDWQGNPNFSYNNRPAYTDKQYLTYIQPAVGKPSPSLSVLELFSEWFNAMDQKPNYGYAVVSEDGSSRVIYGARHSDAPRRPHIHMNYYESPAAPTIAATPRGNAANSGTGYVDLSWNTVEGAKRYYVGIFNGKEYEYFLQPLGATTFSTQGKGIWPTQAEIDAGRYQLHHDGTGAELPMSPAFTYAKAPGGAYATNTNYFFKVIPANQFGQSPDPSQARFDAAAKAVSLPDTIAPNQPTSVTVSPSTYTNAATATVLWNGVTDFTTTGTSTSLGATGNIQYAIDNTTTWVDTSVRTASGTFDFSTTGLTDGQHTIYIRGKDAAGNTGAFRGYYFYIDKTPPTAPTVAIVPDDWTAEDEVAVTWSGISDLAANLPLAQVEYKLGAGSFATTGQTDQAYTGYAVDVSAVEGAQTVSVRGIDRAGNNGAPGTATAYIDHSAPTVDSVTIVPDTWTALDSVTLAWQGARDAYSGLGSMTYALNGGTAVDLGSDEEGSATVDVSALTDGQHTLTVLLADTVGNEHDTDLDLYIDRSDPEVALLAPVDGEEIAGIAEVWGNVSDLSVRSWTLTVTGEDGVSKQLATGTGNLTAQILGRLNCGLFKDGEQVRLSLTAEDVAGNQSTVTGGYLIVDKSVKALAGGVQITAPTSGQTLTTTKVQGAYTVDFAGENVTHIFVDGKYVHDAQAGQVFDLYPILYQEGSMHSVTAISRDNANGVHFSNGLGSNALLSDAFADDTLLAHYDASITFAADGSGASGTGSLTSVAAHSNKPLLAFRLHATASGSGITYAYSADGGAWTAITPEAYAVFTAPVHDVQVRAQLPGGVTLHGWEVEGVVELNPTRFLSKLEKKVTPLTFTPSAVSYALPMLSTKPAPAFALQKQYINDVLATDNFALDALCADEGGSLQVTLLGEDSEGQLYASGTPTSQTLLREVVHAPQSTEERTLTSTGPLYALRLVPWSDGVAPTYTYSVDNGATWLPLKADDYTPLARATASVQVRAQMPGGSTLKAWHIEGVSASGSGVGVRILQAPTGVTAADYGAYPAGQQKTVVS